MSAAESPLLLDRRGRVCLLTLNRPDKMNALSLELVDTLTRKLEQLAREVEAPVLVIRGAGDEAFCSGFDIRKRHPKRGYPEQANGMSRECAVNCD